MMYAGLCERRCAHVCLLTHLCMLEKALTLSGLLLAQTAHALCQLTCLPSKQLSKGCPVLVLSQSAAGFPHVVPVFVSHPGMKAC